MGIWLVLEILPEWITFVLTLVPSLRVPLGEVWLAAFGDIVRAFGIR